MLCSWWTGAGSKLSRPFATSWLLSGSSCDFNEYSSGCRGNLSKEEELDRGDGIFVAPWVTTDSRRKLTLLVVLVSPRSELVIVSM